MKEIFDILKSSSTKWLNDNVIYLTKHGSHCYGTNTPTSDLDVRGVCIPPIKKYNLGILDKFEQAIFREPIDLTVFGITKFVNLALNANPNAIEIIFTEPEDHLFVNKDGQKLLDIRDSFLSTKLRYSLAGYARSQLNRLMLHRRWIVNPILAKPERKDYGLPENNSLLPQEQLLEIEAAIRKVLNDWDIDTSDMEDDKAVKFKNELYDILVELKINHEDMDLYAARYLGLNDNLVEEFKKERRYKNALRDYKHYQEWKKNRNKDRAELEEKFQYDCKHGMHLVRLFRQCEDVLKTGKFIVKRSDAKELLEIRNGAWTFDYLIEWANNKDKEMDQLYKTSTLRHEPERVKVNEWLINLLSEKL